MLNSEPTPELVLSFVAAVILSFFFISIGHRFIETVTDKTTETHLGSGLISGAYLGFDVDPDTLVIKELIDLTAIIGSSSLSSILTFLTVLSAFEIFVGQLHILDKRGRIGVLGSGAVAYSGYLFPNVAEAAMILLPFGLLCFLYSEESGF